MSTTDGNFHDTFPAFVTTTDATVTTCGSYTMPDEASARVHAVVLGRQSASTNAAAYEITAAVKRETGTLSQITGSPVAEATMEDDAAWAATIDVLGNDVRVRVTGVAATTITWQATIEIIVYKP